MLLRRFPSPGASAARHSRAQSGHRARRGIALGLTAVLSFGISASAFLAFRLNGNVDRVDITNLVAKPSPGATREPNPTDPNLGAPVNILLLGSDERDGANESIGGADPSLASDTAIVAHLSADRSRIELVSIPRDSMVSIPACTGTNGSTSKPRSKAIFNSAFSIGWNLGGDIASAAACTMSTVQANTGLSLDHVAIVDMIGFQRMVDAIGGVDICIPSRMVDAYTGLDAAAGNQHFDGVRALQFARARHVEGTDGSDLNRIGNQQRLLSAVMTTALSKNDLGNVPKLISFLSAATSSMTTDADLTLQTMASLVYNTRSVRSGDITFMTIPNGPDPADGNRVVWTSASEAIWSNMVQDLPIVTAEEPVDPAAPSAPGPASDPPLPPTPTPTPTPTEAKNAGREPFTGDDITAVCD
ncbi:LCP family protein [Pengzhenrongella frigida]|uniref:LytR family transcriptional regulator n=1 Tax=Pengzhenrongella frigida TaxID=1259133 RepID=A0A4V1ZHS2_9MICO|nr:LCP family protein [Cellulomonas sp. HLT2-17]RYV53034.1 LytR family transcriptional regulator [Cellulomonas sp. HLT2-17]